MGATKMLDTRNAFLRMMDANYNRAKEALRVSEDILRFVLNDKKISSRCKFLRHRLTQIFLTLSIPYAKIVQSRRSRHDVGREFVLSDQKHPRPVDIFLSNVKRAEEATRVLEEVARAVFPNKARSFERLRFSIYELEKQALKKF